MKETGPNRVLTIGPGLGYPVQGHGQYQVHLWIRQISPTIWRRVLVRRESTLAQLD